MKKRIDYSGKKVNVGIDVHKKTYSVCCECEGQVVKKATVPAIPGKLVQFLKEHFEGAEIRSCYEAGFAGFGLHRTLVSNRIDNIVVNPASIEVAAKDKVKTDKRDCKRQAIQLAANRLESIYIPSVEQEGERLLTRTREQLVSERTRSFGPTGPQDSFWRVSARTRAETRQKLTTRPARYSSIGMAPFRSIRPCERPMRSARSTRIRYDGALLRSQAAYYSCTELDFSRLSEVGIPQSGGNLPSEAIHVQLPPSTFC